MVAIASLSVQMIPFTSTEEAYQKCTISEEKQHYILRNAYAEHQYSVEVHLF